MKTRQLKTIIPITIYLLLSAIFSWIVATRIGLFELPDGYFYVVIGQYLLTGLLMPVFPYNAVKPQTLFGPLYGILTAKLLMLPPPWGMTILTFLQVYGICISGLLLFYIAKTSIGKKAALPAVVFFFSLPFLWIYATSLMSESITIFFLTIYAAITTFFLHKKREVPVSVLVLMAAVLCLTKNVYIFLVIGSFVIWFYVRWKYKRKERIPLMIARSTPAYLGVFLVFLWMMFNYVHHGVFTTTINTGRYMYNNVIYQGKFLPPADLPITKEFIDRAGSLPALVQPEWEAQRFYMRDFQAGKMTEVQIDNKFREVSIAAIKAQPLDWFLNVFGIAYGDIVSPPYHKSILTMIGLKDDQCPECVARTCRIIWNHNLCLPMNPNQTLLRLWGNLLIVERTIFYPNLFTILLIFALIGSIRALICKNVPMITMTILFWFFLFIQAAVQQIEGRYMLALYPFFTLICIYGITQTIHLIKTYTKILKNSEEWKMST